MALAERFSKRHGFSGRKEIVIREDAPENLRYFVVQTTLDLGVAPSRLREIVCRMLRIAPNPRHRWNADIRDEVRYHVDGCDWFKVYDLIEVFYSALAQGDEYSGEDNAGGLHT